MATRPSRLLAAPKVVREILPQVDFLFLHLDGFDKLPRWANHRKIQASLHPEGSLLGAAGKLEPHEQASEDDIVMMVDDDVRLPVNLTKVLRRSLKMRSAPTLFGYHGATLTSPMESYLEDRQVTRLESALPQDLPVDVVATCVAAYVKSDFSPKHTSWAVRNSVDLQLAIDAECQGVGRVLLARRANWLSFRDSFQPDSIYRKLVENDSRQTLLANQLLGIN